MLRRSSWSFWQNVVGTVKGMPWNGTLQHTNGTNVSVEVKTLRLGRHPINPPCATFGCLEHLKWSFSPLLMCQRLCHVQHLHEHRIQQNLQWGTPGRTSGNWRSQKDASATNPSHRWTNFSPMITGKEAKYWIYEKLIETESILGSKELNCHRCPIAKSSMTDQQQSLRVDWVWRLTRVPPRATSCWKQSV